MVYECTDPPEVRTADSPAWDVEVRFSRIHATTNVDSWFADTGDLRNWERDQVDCELAIANWLISQTIDEARDKAREECGA